jgi:glycosyltransferase involved in cell wall biosynthesis
MLFLCSLLKTDGQVLVYDNLDMPTHKYWGIRKIFKLLEMRALKKTDGILYASRFFPKFYKASIKSLILENKPLKIVNQGFKDSPIRSKITISFLGTLRYVESLKILMDAAANCDNINLVIRGSGFANELIAYAETKKYPNVSLIVGWFDYGDLGKLVSETDIIWAAYPSKDFNVKYAISNKFFEAMVFNKPGIFSENTRLGKFVGDNKIGFTVDPYDVHSIEKLFNHLQNKDGEIINVTKKKLKGFAPEDVFWEDEEKNLISFIRSL